MSKISYSKVTKVAETILQHVEERVNKAEEKQLSDNDLLSLYSVFGVVLQRALDILEKYNTVICYVTLNKLRSIIEINGENNRCYRIFPRVNFCPCRAFKHQVLDIKSQIFCKHVLAARIAQILGRIEEQIVSQEQYLILVKSMFELGVK